MAKTKLPVFEGKPLIEIPEFIPTAGFLESNFGKAFMKEYSGRAKSDYGNVQALRVLSYNNGVVTGSNPFAVVLSNRVAEQEGLKVATQADLETALKVKTLPLSGHYEDTGLVLRNEGEPNSYLAGNLMDQIKDIDPKAKMPAMIPLSQLELSVDANSPHGLTFKLKEDAEIFYDLSVLNKEGNFSNEDIDKKMGLPKKLGNGNRTLYTRDSGLSRLFLFRNLDVYSWDGSLSYSSGDGRVVLVSAEGTAKNFLKEALKKYQAKLTDLNAKRDRALAILNE